MFKFLAFSFFSPSAGRLALIAVILYPIVWLVMLPFRIVGIAVGGTFHLVEAIFMLPVRVLRAV